MKKRLDIVQSSTEPSREVLWMTDGTLSYWGNKGWTEVNKSHNEIPSSGKEGQFLKYGKSGLEWESVNVPTKVSELTNDSGYALKSNVLPLVKADNNFLTWASGILNVALQNKWKSDVSNVTVPDISLVSGFQTSQVDIEEGICQFYRASQVIFVLCGEYLLAFGGGISSVIIQYTDSTIATIKISWIVNERPDWSTLDSSADSFIENKPTKLSQFTNDMNFKSDVPETIMSTDPNGNDTLGLLDIIQSYAYDLVKSGKTRGNYLTSDTPKLDPVGRITGNGFVTGDSLRGWYAMWEEGSSWINITIIPGRNVSGVDNHNIAMIIYTYESKSVRIEIVPRVYTLPAASASAIGGVKKVTLAKLDTSADITAVVEAYNSLVDKLVSSGIASV